jgi:hypothetical protein
MFTCLSNINYFLPGKNIHASITVFFISKAIDTAIAMLKIKIHYMISLRLKRETQKGKHNVKKSY